MSTAERLAENLCLGEIPEKRAWRNCHFCSNACHDEYRRQRRNWRAEKACRLCGKRLRKKTQPAAEQTQPEAVLTAHNRIVEVVTA